MKQGRDKTALLVVDVQVGVVANAHRREEVVTTIAELVTRARTEGIPVVWVQHHDDELARESPDWQLVPELRPRSDEPVIHKSYGDAFAETNLEAQLQRLSVGRLVLCGAQSDFCITATLTGSLYRGYSVALVSDAHTTEDSTYRGNEYAAERIIGWVNRHAAFTRLPGVSSRLVTSSAAFDEVPVRS